MEGKEDIRARRMRIVRIYILVPDSNNLNAQIKIFCTLHAIPGNKTLRVNDVISKVYARGVRVLLVITFVSAVVLIASVRTHEENPVKGVVLVSDLSKRVRNSYPKGIIWFPDIIVNDTGGTTVEDLV